MSHAWDIAAVQFASATTTQSIQPGTPRPGS